MKLTVFILSLPVVIFLTHFLAEDASDTFQLVLGLLWVLSSVFCIAWGFYISRRSRLLGWLCIVVGIIPLILMMIPPTVNHGAKTFELR